MNLQSLRLRLLLAFLTLAILPLVLGGGLLAWLSYESQVAEIDHRQRDLAARMAVELESFFRGIELRLASLDLVREFTALAPEEQRRRLAVVLAERHDFRELALLDVAGREQAKVSAAEPVAAADLRSRADREEFLWPARHGHTYSGPIRFDRETGEPLMILAVPFIDGRDGPVKSVLVAELRVRRIWELMQERGLVAGQAVAIVDAGRRVIAHRNPSVVLRETRLSAMPVDGLGAGVDGGSAYVMTRPFQIGQQAFTLVAEYAVAQALVPAQRAAAVIGGATLLALAMVLVLAWFAVRRIVVPVEAVSAAAKAVRDGDLTRRVAVVRNDEIGELAASFNAMTGELRAAVERQRQAMAEIEDLYNRAPCGYHSLGPDGRYSRINDTELAWLGYRREEVVDRLSFMDLVAPGSRQVFLDTFPRLKEQGWIRDVELDLVRRDGSILPVLISASAVRDADGHFLTSRTTLYDITGRQQAERALRDSEARLYDAQRRANQELEARVVERTAQLEEANRELEAFAYSVSHDLRAPLRAIDGFSRIVVEDYGGRLDDEGQRLLDVIRDNTARMSQLIDDILAFSRTGRQQIATAAVDLGKLAQEVFDELLASLPGRQIRLVQSLLPLAWGDRALLRQVLVNLLANAIKFTQPRTEAVIELGGSADAEENLYSLRDNGVGFDMRYVDKLFGVFQRLHSAQEFEGTGIGLAIVKRIVTRHGGRVWAEGEPGKGATIHFTLPRQGTA